VAGGRGSRLADVWEDLGRNGMRRREGGPTPWIDREVDIGWVCMGGLSGCTKGVRDQLEVGCGCCQRFSKVQFHPLYCAEAKCRNKKVVERLRHQKSD